MALFKPLLKTKTGLSSVPIVAGQLIFTTDTKETFIDIDNSTRLQCVSPVGWDDISGKPASFIPYGVGGGTANALTATVSPAITLTAGTVISVNFSDISTSVPTFNVNSTGAKYLYRSYSDYTDGNILPSRLNGTYLIAYNGSAWVIISGGKPRWSDISGAPTELDILNSWTTMPSADTTLNNNLKYRRVDNISGTCVGFDVKGISSVGTSMTTGGIQLTLPSAIVSAMPNNTSYSFIVPVLPNAAPPIVTKAAAFYHSQITIYKLTGNILMTVGAISSVSSTSMLTSPGTYKFDFGSVKIRWIDSFQPM